MATHLMFEGLEDELFVTLAAGVDAAMVGKACDILLPGWRRRSTAAPAMPEDIAIVTTEGGYEIRARSWDGGVAVASDVNNLANALGGLLVDALLARHPALCCIHAAAVSFSDRAILFVGRSGAGKSTLALRFAARGHRIFGDDRVLVDTRKREVVALGLTPKARLPLPPGDGLAEFVAARTVMNDGSVCYLHLRPHEQAGFGQRIPLTTIVLVERQPELAGPVEFTGLGSGPIAAGLIGEATTPGTAATVVKAVARLARQAAGRRLRFFDGEHAVDAILRELALPYSAMIT